MIADTISDEQIDAALRLCPEHRHRTGAALVAERARIRSEIIAQQSKPLRTLPAHVWPDSRPHAPASETAASGTTAAHAAPNTRKRAQHR